MRGGFLLVFGFMALVLRFVALGCLAGLLGSGTVHSKLILLEQRSGEPPRITVFQSTMWVYPRESRGRRPPGSSSCRRCWLGLVRGASQGAGQPVGQSKMQGPGGWQDQPSIVDQAAVVKGDADAVGVVASIGWSWSVGGFVLRKPLSPKHRSALLTPLTRRDIHLLGGLGLISGDENS